MATYDILDFDSSHGDAVRQLILGILRDELHAANEQEVADNLQNVEAAYASPGSRFLVAMCDGNVVATGAIHRISDVECELRWLFVHQGYRREGLASMLFAKLLPFAQERGYKRLLLEIGPEMETYTKVYMRYGFADLPQGADASRPGHWMTVDI